MAVVMIAGPQILSAIFLATSPNWRRNSAAYILGACISITLVVTVAFLFIHVAINKGASSETFYVVVLVLLLLAMAHTFARRGESQPPKWMGKLENANPRLAFRLGFLLLGVFPTDILTSLAIGSFLATHGEPWWHALPFIALTLLLLAVPALLLLALGERAEVFLPKAREWMNTHSWIVNEIVLLFFIALTADGAGWL